MTHQSFAQTVLETLEAMAGNGEVTATALSNALHLQTLKDHKRMLNTVSDLVKSGRVARVRQGVYRRSGRIGEPDKREVMWRTLRMRRVVSIADLQELAGVSHCYAKEWLLMLVKRGIAVRVDPADLTQPRTWRLIKHDLTEMPVDTEKALQLRALRQKQKDAIVAAIDRIDTDLRTVRAAISGMEEE